MTAGVELDVNAAGFPHPENTVRITNAHTTRSRISPSKEKQSWCEYTFAIGARICRLKEN
jgi:hypothetical protein